MGHAELFAKSLLHGGDDCGPLQRLSDKRIRARSMDVVLDLVRLTWPSAYKEGSCGHSRIWISVINGEKRLVAYSWTPRVLADWYWVKIAPDYSRTYDADNPLLSPIEVEIMKEVWSPRY